MADIVVIGGANVDIKAKSDDAMRLGTSNPGQVSTTAGGVARNIAHNLARLGASVSLISAIGRDAHGEALLATTTAAGVDVSNVLRPDGLNTSSYLAFLNSNGELVTALSDMNIVKAITPEIISSHSQVIQNAKLVVADCNLAIETLLAIATLAREKLFIEPVSVPKSEKLLQILATGAVFLSSPNFDQVEHLAKSRDIETAFKFLHGKGLRNAVIHAGSDGAFVSDGINIDVVEPQLAGPIVDVTGAGDAAVAGLLFGLLRGDDLLAAATLGQQLAGRVIASPRSNLD